MPKISALPGLLTPTLDDLFVCVDTSLTPTMHTDKVLVSTMLDLFEANIVITDANFSGVLGLNHGGTNAALVASANSLFYSTASGAALLATQNSSVLLTTAAGVHVQSATMTDGQLIIGNTGNTPSVGSLSAGANISITPGAGTISIAATGSASFSWTEVVGTTQAAAVNSGYITANVAQTTVTLPATAPVGSIVAVVGKGNSGWRLVANTGQTIKLGSSTTSSGGDLTATNQFDSVEVVAITANTTWVARFVIGNLQIG